MENADLKQKLDRIKDQVLNKVLIIVLFVQLIGLIISLIRVSQTGFIPLYGIHIVLVIAVFYLYFFRHKISTTLRGGIFMGAMYTMAIAGLCTWGLYGFGYVYFVPATAIAFLYFNRKTGWILTTLSLATILGIAFLFNVGILSYAPSTPNYMQTFGMWLNMIISLCLVSIVITLFWNNLFKMLIKTNETISEQQAILQKMNDELVLAKEQAEQSDKLKSAFLANISHEIRTPLNVIIGFSNMVAENEDPEERQQLNHIVRENCDVMLKLVNDIVDFSKIESNTLILSNSTFKVQELLDELYSTLHGITLPGVNLIIEKNGSTIYADRERVFQLMFNLVHNALKFTQSGQIIVKTWTENENFHFQVSDTGIGIPLEEQEKIFHRFYKIDAFSQGAGLGLCLVKWIVKLMKGEIFIQSQPSEGSTFEFSIPEKATAGKQKTNVSKYEPLIYNN
jgi:signal transduction histidine kinase